MTKYQEQLKDWPWTEIQSTSKNGLLQCKQLAELLPHGSGINGTWKIKKQGKKFICSNYYEAMTESGFYCHTYDFTVYYQLNGGKFEFIKLSFHGQREYTCCGYGVKDYLTDIMP